jgi:dipeptidyl aminopeptidase/acylaminoacyl peptidase
VVAWRAWRGQGGNRSAYWGRSLSPLKEAGKIKPGTVLRIVVGTKDTNTLPKFSETFLAKLQAGGVQADLTYVEGATHSSVLKTPEFIKVARQMARKLQRGAGSGQGGDD